ncbi:alpha/beta hydrolase family protein [Chitinophaga ginsengisegetis]|uniref:alpha/beta hydrolase family protein n=1 Tax=Chitinophaga ginsengisegetis TaxID=393003 RepID=UPI000DBA3CD3|nr:prolyl oligopeptidase family serine peptidase [Chitinophaga ginsengisegetis]MDR6567451.1 dienelactone hydrolase [Chitinophaga ginsengisegetis]MDR6647182.1 dienelactone hydrolase [Chitinophaga ginsengisegetis]MDR6653531.1 dienelactone hydrolase [Chitinophaga ginsengisegetis]
MKFNCILWVFIFFCGLSDGQDRSQIEQNTSLMGGKPCLDSCYLNNWSYVDKALITNDGNYVAYSILNKPLGQVTMVIMASKFGWNRYLIGVDRVIFSPDSRKAIWRNASDSLCILELGREDLSYIPNVVSFNLHGNHLFYQLGLPGSDLGVLNLITSHNTIYEFTKTYWVSRSERIAVLDQTLDCNDRTKHFLSLVNLENNNVKRIWVGDKVSSLVVDTYGSKVAFIANDKKGQRTRCIWYYDSVSAKNICLVSDSFLVSNRLRIDWVRKFGVNGACLFFETKRVDSVCNKTYQVALKVWNYMDVKLQSNQLMERSDERFLYVVDLHSGKLTRLEFENETLLFPSEESSSDSFALLFKQDNDNKGGESKWNVSCKMYLSLISTISGERILIDSVNHYSFIELSPNGKYLIYYDRIKKFFFSYEIATSITRNVTFGIDDLWERDGEDGEYGHRVIGAWIIRDEAFLLYSKWNIWQIDPKGIIRPINLTNNYGKDHETFFSLALSEYSSRPLLKKETIYFTAFNRSTKDNGFYQKVLGEVGNPDSLTIGPYLYNIPDNPCFSNDLVFYPVKALNVNRFIVRRMNATESPNFFLTDDFKKFTSISDLHPENEVNWYTTELHNWVSLDGRALQGILYKPENFDSSKMYPVIFHYYERKSDGLNAYLRPRLLENGCAINIPYYVSNGYLVFCPDIYYKIGDPMEGTYNSIISSVNYMSKLGYVNSRKLALQGCSWGAIQTNYLVTRTGIFAAACSASGIADWVSGYGSLMDMGIGMQGFFETGQLRMGRTLWDIPRIYLKNSAIMNADRVTTPVLIMHTQYDGVCAFDNIREFFISLYRLRKQVWMLVYEGDHGVWGKEANDYSIRMKQFFDHYLMDKPAPKWMTEELQPNDTGLGLTDSIKIRESLPGLLN